MVVKMPGCKLQYLINPFLSDELVRYNQLGVKIYILRVMYFYKQTTLDVTNAFCNCLPMSHKKDSRPQRLS